ncbi:unnamed protein product [Phaeothamnion confervicola]
MATSSRRWLLPLCLSLAARVGGFMSAPPPGAGLGRATATATTPFSPAGAAAIFRPRGTAMPPPRRRTGRFLPPLSMTVSPARGSSRGRPQHSQREEVVYAQDVLDRAWRYEGAAAGDGNGEGAVKTTPRGFGSRLLDVFGGPPSFLDDRDYMDDILDNVIRIYCTHNLPSFSMPWQRLRQEQSTSTGFVIEGQRILTNAHSVEYCTIIQVRKRGSDRKFQARVLAVGDECDLAVLTVEDPDFWRDAWPLELVGEVPQLTDDVTVLGYPVGGDCISITAGVVSRVEMTVYAQAGLELLSIQIDAAINPGNSGGPVVNDRGEVVGVAFQSLEGDDVENIGWLVPVNVVQHFLEDVRRHGRYLGFPRLGASLQHLESPALRKSLGMAERQTGVLVADVEPICPASRVLQKGDVIMSADGIRVANDGTIPFRDGERVALRYYFSQLFPGDSVRVTVLRGGRVTVVTAPLYVSDALVPAHFYGAPPSYAVVGGLVFTVLSNPYISAELEGNAGGMTHMLSLSAYGRREAERQEIVILTQVLSHQVNLGYEGLENLHLTAFNGQNVTNMAHLCRLVDETNVTAAPFLRFDFYPDRAIVLEAGAVPRATAEICMEHFIPAARSGDLPPAPPPTAAAAPIVAAAA